MTYNTYTFVIIIFFIGCTNHQTKKAKGNNYKVTIDFNNDIPKYVNKKNKIL